MNKLLLLLVFSALVLSQQLVFAQHQKLAQQEEWIVKINENTQSIKSLTADFEQMKNMSFLDEAVVSKGKFWFKEPEQIRWEYQSPYNYIMIMSKGVLIVKDEGDEYSTDLSSNKIFEQMNGLISGSIQGKLLDNDQDYSKEYYEDTEHIIIRLLPKDSHLSAYLDYMELWFNKLDLQVDVLLMHEPSGDYTEMKFYNRKMNPLISADVFE